MKSIIAIIVVGLIALSAIFLLPRLQQQRTTDTTNANNTLNLAEFGVALTIPASIREMTYVAKTQQGVGTILFMQQPEGCNLGAIYEIQKNAIAQSRTTWTKEKLEQFESPQGDVPAQVKEFTNFYLVFEPSQAACTSDAAQTEQETKRRSDLWNALTTAHYMQ